MDAEIASAFGADVKILPYILHIDGFPTLIALSPHSRRNPRFLFLFFRPLRFRGAVSGVDPCICLLEHIPQHGKPPSLSAVWKMGRDKIRIHISIFKIPVSDELILEIHIGGDPLDDQLSQGAPHLGNGRWPVLVVDDEL